MPLLCGDDARSLRKLCDEMSVPVARTVRGLAEHLAVRWNRYADVPDALTLRDLVEQDNVAAEAPGTLRLAVSAPRPASALAHGVELSVSWDEGVLGRPTVVSFIDSLRTLITGCVARPDADLADLAVVPASGVRRLIELGHGGEPGDARYRTVPEAVLDWATLHPERPAVSYGGRTLSYAHLAAQASAVADALAAAGVSDGDRVLLYGQQSDLAVVGMLACHLRGAGYVPLDVDSPAKRVRQVAAGAGATACLWGEGTEETDPAAFLPPGLSVVRLRRDLPAASGSVAPPDLAAAAYVLHSSGSTGAPKGIEVTHSSLAHFCREINDAYTVTPDDRVLAFARPVFDISVFEVFATLAAGAQVVVADAETRMDPMLLTDLLQAEKVTVAELPPALLPLLDPAELPGLRLVSVGGEAVPGSLVGEWASADRQFWNGYGPTETTVAITLQQLTGEWTAPPPIGRPIPGCTAYVVDEALRLRPQGAIGELCVSGPSLATGYLDDPIRTAASFTELPEVPGTRVYRTGDLVRWRGDGALDYLGRADRQVKVNGFRVELAEVEDALMSVGGVRQAVVEMVAALGGGRTLSALVVGDSHVAHGEILMRAAELLPPYAVPGRLVGADEIPLTPNGKVDRVAVAQLLSEQ
jgi:peptide synthetase PhsC